MEQIFDRYKVIDVDTHVTEPRDVWTSRVSSKWGDRIPHVVRLGNVDMWMIGDKPVLPPGGGSSTGGISAECRNGIPSRGARY